MKREPPQGARVLTVGVKLGASFALELLHELGLVDRERANEAMCLTMRPELAELVARAAMFDNDGRDDERPGMTPADRQWPKLRELVQREAKTVREKLEERAREGAARAAKEGADDAYDAAERAAFERERELAEHRARSAPPLPFDPSRPRGSL